MASGPNWKNGNDSAPLFISSLPGAVAEEPRQRSQSDHWSLQPVSLPGVPDKSPNPVDAFILARLEKAGLAMAPEADRATLIRRVTFDLTGLPPTPEEVEAFVNSTSPDAWAALIDRLLASPRYGERWGRHWLDVVRYTESNGFEYDRLRDNGWHYRDYVIRSFNDDQPYDVFMRQQIAGDELEPATPDSIVAASLMVCGPCDQAANIQANPTQRAVAREDELEDLIGVVSQTFLGLTMNCARCHDHKTDPIPQADYYRLKSVFDGVRPGERPIDSKGTLSYAGKREQPAPTHLLPRGDVKSPGPVVAPGAPLAITALASDFALPPDAPVKNFRILACEIFHKLIPALSRTRSIRWPIHSPAGPIRCRSSCWSPLFS